uniref:Chromo domain-containing protein n=1 Tax=Elaeophora elaphi TaxID=1147741 RepID=A0A0R3RRN0_9BILA
MPLIDMAEAVSRGDIIVDEVDALNAVNSGKLSEIETARFSPLVIEHSRRQSGGNGSAVNRTDPLPNLDGIELGEANGAAGSDDEHTWNNVLVDEVDFVHAVERGRISRNDLHIMGCRSSGDTWIPQRVVDDVEELGDISYDENGWNRVLVDEVDILHAVEQGSRIINRSECRLSYMHRENGIERSEMNSDIVRRANSTRNGESSFEIDRTIGTGRPGRGKQ